MAEEHTQPIIVKKIKKGGHGHHGGAWKIAYADFVTAMMAFFLLMWLLGSTTQAEREGISDYFNSPTAIESSGGTSTSTIKVGGGKDVTYSEGETNKSKAEVGEITKVDKERLEALKKEVEQAIDASQALKPFKDQILLEITKEGLRIQIIDKENRPMFASGSPVLQGYASQLLKELGKVITHVPNKISLSGHTDATPFSSLPGAEYSNWELSADRANASRRALISGGMEEGKIARVVGLSSAVLFDKQNPTNPVNRRISIIVLNKETEDAILHDEGKLDQTNAEAASATPATNALTTSPAAAAAPLPEKPATVVTPASAAAPANAPTTALPVIPVKPGTVPTSSTTTTVAAPVATSAVVVKPTPTTVLPTSTTPATAPKPVPPAPGGGIAPVIAPAIGPITPPPPTANH